MKNKATLYVTIFVILAICVMIYADFAKRYDKVEKKVGKVERGIEKVKKFDAEKFGKKVGDLKRKFLKGYKDTTVVVDTVKN